MLDRSPLPTGFKWKNDKRNTRGGSHREVFVSRLYVAIVAVVLSGDIANGQRLGFVTGQAAWCGCLRYGDDAIDENSNIEKPLQLLRWTGEEYSNYARENYGDTYPPSWKVSCDMYRLYHAGLNVDWTIDSPASGSIVRKGPSTPLGLAIWSFPLCPKVSSTLQ